MKYLILIITLIFTGCFQTQQNIKHHERYYQTQLCKKLNGVMEYRLKDKTRVDCLTDK